MKPVDAATESSLIERYLELGLRFSKLVPEFADSYYGPPEIRARVAAETVPDPAVLGEQSEDLATSIDEVDLADARARWLRAQVGGLGTAARVLSGKRLSYSEQVEACHGVTPTFLPEEELADAHHKLDEVLPGRGAVAARYQRWLSSQLVPGDAILPALRSLADEFRERTSRLLDLPKGEKIEFKLVRGKQWSAAAFYQGGFRSHISINVDLPVWSFRLVEFIAHEVYPGHHTEHVFKEDQLVRRRGYLEETVRFQANPQSLISEGLAELALEVLLPRDADVIAAHHLRPLGLPYDEKIATTLRDVNGALRFIRPNILHLLDHGNLPLEEAYAYARRWMLEPDDHVERVAKSAIQRPWPPYESCYTDGFRICRAFVNGDPHRFKRLLTEQLTPADLLGATSNQDTHQEH